MAAHVASATIRRIQQETKSHKAHLKLTNQPSSPVECDVNVGNGDFVTVPLGPGELESIAEVPGAEANSFEDPRAFTPVSSSTPVKKRYSPPTEPCNEVRSSSTCSTDTESTSSPSGELPFSTATSMTSSSSDAPQFIAPILGYEILEQRARFTVFKIHVQRIETQDSWFVFRRYTDFTRLSRKLRGLFPASRFLLPPKRWFKDNFDPAFLDARVLGLQAFVNRLLSHREVCQSHHVRDFFCFDDPPGPEDCLEESRLRCETLEDMVTTLRSELTGKQAEIDSIRAELALTKAQREILLKSLRIERSVGISMQAANKYNAISSTSQSSSANGFKSGKTLLNRDSPANSIQTDSCDDSYTTAIQCSGEDIGNRETLIEKSDDGSDRVKPRNTRNEFEMSIDSRNSDIHHRNYAYVNGDATADTTTDDNGNQTFSKPVELHLHDATR